VPFRRTALLIAVLGALHGALYIPLVSTTVKTDSWSYVAAANALRDGAYSTPLKAGFYFVFRSGWYDITGTRVDETAWQAPERQAFRPPGYPLYLAPFGRKPILEGDHTLALLGQAVLFGAGTLLLILTVRRWFDERVGLLAGLLYAIDPWSKHYVALVLTEALAGFLVLATAYMFTRAWQSGRLITWAGTAALAASLALVRAVFVLVPPLVAVAALFRAGVTRERLLRAGAALSAAAALIVPWLAWTDHVGGRATMAVWGEGYNAILAASGEGRGRTWSDIEADPAFSARLERIRATIPGAAELRRDPTAHPRYLANADHELRTAAGDLYRERLRDEPQQVAWEFIYRMWFLWAAHTDWYQPGGLLEWALLALDWVLLALALFGSAVALRRGGPARAVVVGVGVYTVVVATHHVEARFGIPLRGLYLGFVAVALTSLGPLRQRAEQEEREPERDGRRAADGGEERLRRGEDEPGDRDTAGSSSDAR
jgi:Dolichyl-phosphate-mannose-protein mannosyltransferase